MLRIIVVNCCYLFTAKIYMEGKQDGKNYIILYLRMYFIKHDFCAALWAGMKFDL